MILLVSLEGWVQSRGGDRAAPWVLEWCALSYLQERERFYQGWQGAVERRSNRKE